MKVHFIFNMLNFITLLLNTIFLPLSLQASDFSDSNNSFDTLRHLGSKKWGDGLKAEFHRLIEKELNKLDTSVISYTFIAKTPTVLGKRETKRIINTLKNKGFILSSAFWNYAVTINGDFYYHMPTHLKTLNNTKNAEILGGRYLNLEQIPPKLLRAEIAYKRALEGGLIPSLQQWPLEEMDEEEANKIIDWYLPLNIDYCKAELYGPGSKADMHYYFNKNFSQLPEKFKTKARCNFAFEVNPALTITFPENEMSIKRFEVASMFPDNITGVYTIENSFENVPAQFQSETVESNYNSREFRKFGIEYGGECPKIFGCSFCGYYSTLAYQKDYDSLMAKPKLWKPFINSLPLPTHSK